MSVIKYYPVFGLNFVIAGESIYLTDFITNSFGTLAIGSRKKDNGKFLLSNGVAAFNSLFCPEFAKNIHDFHETYFLLDNNKFVALDSKQTLVIKCENYQILTSYKHPLYNFSACGVYIQIDDIVINTDSGFAEKLPTPHLKLIDYTDINGWVCINNLGHTFTKTGKTDNLTLTYYVAGINIIARFKGVDVEMPHFVVNGEMRVIDSFIIVNGNLTIVENTKCRLYGFTLLIDEKNIEVWKIGRIA